jgi:hypothetical protein
MSKAQLGNTNGLGHKHTDETRAKMSAAQMGAKGGSYKGPMVGTNIKTGEVIIFEGAAAAKAAGFHAAHICDVINGKYGYKTHKNHTWTRGQIE